MLTMMRSHAINTSPTEVQSAGAQSRLPSACATSSFLARGSGGHCQMVPACFDEG